MKDKRFMDEKQKKLAQEWFDAAESDYQFAEIGLKESYIFPQVAFLSQQSAEKFLKGFLVLNRQEPPYIHDLSKLLDSCIKTDPELESLRDACETLIGFYIETRYPPDIPDYTKKEIEDAFAQATLVKEAIQRLVEKKANHGNQ